MRIWIVNQAALSPREAGHTRHFSLGRMLAGRGHDVTIVASSLTYLGQTVPVATEAGLAEETIDGVRFVWLKGRPYHGNGIKKVLNMVDFAARAAALGPHLGTPPHVIIGSSPSPFAALAALVLARRLQTPFVLEVRDLWPLTLMELSHFRPWHPLVLALIVIEHALYRGAKHIVTVLPNAASHIRAVARGAAAITWLPNGVDLDLVPPPGPPPARDGLSVVYAGAHGVANALDNLLDTVRLLERRGSIPGLSVRLIGQGAEKQRLQRRVEDEGLRSVRFEPAVAKREIYRLLGEADVLVACLAPSSLYRFGISLNKLYDYMAVARPVVLAARASNDPVREANGGYTVEPGDPPAMADALERVHAMSPSERAAMGDRGRAFVVAQHDFATLAARLEGLLAQVAAGDLPQGLLVHPAGSLQA